MAAYGLSLPGAAGSVLRDSRRQVAVLARSSALRASAAASAPALDPSNPATTLLATIWASRYRG